MEGKRIEVIVGTTEEYILGYELCTTKDGKIFLEQRFADHSHTGSIRQVAVGGKYLVSGGTDEHIKVFDLNKHVEVGTLMEHEGTITYLGFHGNRYLFTASEDGKICIFSRKDWKCEKTLRGHKGPVVSVSVHPSGKLALSLSQDRKLRTWDLIKGRKAYITHMDRIADVVQWSPKGKKYVIVKGSCLEVYDVTSCQVVHSIDFKERVTNFTFMTEDIIAVAAGDKNICLYDITNHFELLQWEAHKLRVKSLYFIPRDDEELLLVSASSDGCIKLWKLQMFSLTSKPQLLAEVDTTCRIICMAVYVSSLNNKEKIDNIIKKEKNNILKEEVELSETEDISIKKGKKEKRKADKSFEIKQKKKRKVVELTEVAETEAVKTEIDELPGGVDGGTPEEKIDENKNVKKIKSILKKKKKKGELKENVVDIESVPKKVKKKAKGLKNLNNVENTAEEKILCDVPGDTESTKKIKKKKAKNKIVEATQYGNKIAETKVKSEGTIKKKKQKNKVS